MERDVESVVLRLTTEEAYELFSRCLRSDQDDTDASSNALRKLAGALHSPAEVWLEAA